MNIALIAHDAKKIDGPVFVLLIAGVLSRHF